MVSNPPYVSEAEWDDLPADVRREPRQALVAGPEGTETLLAIAGSARRWLRPGGLIVCEMGEQQAGRLLPAFTLVGQVEVRRDLAGRDRYLLVRSP